MDRGQTAKVGASRGTSTNGGPRRTPTIAIVGAGMSGLCMGIKLKQAGIESFTIYEKADAVGGTWRENTYPGLSCDVPSRFYSYSFEPNPEWTQSFSPGPEIWGYFERVADKYGLRPHIALGREVRSARFEEGRWQLRTADGQESEADFLVSACGILHHPRYPEIEGLESFAGHIFHSARWDHDVQLEGKRVGVIGTGSTGVQIVTAIAERVGHLALFQRTAQWIFPYPNREYSRFTRAALRRSPNLNRLTYHAWRLALEATFARAVIKPGWQRRLISWVCRRHLAKVEDAELRRKLTPDYEPMCKRLVHSSGFYDTMQRPNLELVTEPIDRVVPTGVVTRDGTLHELDVLVLATGFDFHAYMRPMEVVGENGLTLEEAWSEGPRAYRTVALPGFPNLFMLMGPHSPFGNHSLIAIAETQADYVMQWIEMFRAGRFASAVPSGEATARYNAEMRSALPETVWMTGCVSWYLGKDGKPELWPWTPERHREMLREPDLDEFEVRTG